MLIVSLHIFYFATTEPFCNTEWSIYITVLLINAPFFIVECILKLLVWNSKGKTTKTFFALICFWWIIYLLDLVIEHRDMTKEVILWYNVIPLVLNDVYSLIIIAVR